MDSAEGKVGGVLVLKGRRGERSQVTLQAEAARGLGGCLLPVSRRGCWQALFRLALEAGGLVTQLTLVRKGPSRLPQCRDAW